MSLEGIWNIQQMVGIHKNLIGKKF